MHEEILATCYNATQFKTHASIWVFKSYLQTQSKWGNGKPDNPMEAVSTSEEWGQSKAWGSCYERRGKAWGSFPQPSIQAFFLQIWSWNEVLKEF